MTALEVHDLQVAFDVPVLTGVNLSVPRGALTAVLGPSGCGKTTLLRAIAGFIEPSQGRIVIQGRDVFGPNGSVPPEKRGIALVPQEGALFAHLDVAGNVAFGLPRAQRRDAARIAELLDLVGLSGLQKRRAHELSGGQQQRVALARALAPEPSLVLLDEPFAALDAGLRESVRAEVRHVLRRAGAAAVLVTHDQDEALSMADSVAVMDSGRVLMDAAPRQVYTAPQELAVARFVGQVIELPASLVAGANHVDTALGRLAIVRTHSDAAPGHGVATLRPEQLRVLPADVPDGVPGVVTELTYYGHDTMVTVRLDDARGTVVMVRAGELPGPVRDVAPADPVRILVCGAARFFSTDATR